MSECDALAAACGNDDILASGGSLYRTRRDKIFERFCSAGGFCDASAEITGKSK
ncbi:hypothetical protein Y043_6194 [Burkholderia pseudomallei MSHR2138]|nr:hypothetical protein Y043_6194 [Burkholderia pseudomallei MSHR2138]